MQNLIGISGRIGSGKDTVANIIQYLVYRNKKYMYSYAEFISESEIYKVDRSGWEVKKFAAKLKQIVCLLTGCTMEDLESQEFKAKDLPKDWNIRFQHDSDGFLEQAMTYRTLLQKVGTEAMRGQVHDQVWVNSLFADYKQGDVHYPLSEEQREFYNKQSGPVPGTDVRLEFPKWIISDMRFPNEMEAVKSRGGVTIRVYRDSPCKVCHTTQAERRGQSCMEIQCPNGLPQHPSETALDDAQFDYTIDNSGTIEELIGKVEIILKELEII